MKILIIGCGPTALGAACQAFEYVKSGSKIDLIIVEREREPGGLSRTVEDPRGYKWDCGGHVTFSKFDFFNQTMKQCVPLWKTHQRICAIDMALINEGEPLLIPYPIQKSVSMFPSELRQQCARDLRRLYSIQKNDAVQTNGIQIQSSGHPNPNPTPDKPKWNFDGFCRRKFGDTLTEIFFKPYNEKLWRTPLTELNADWISARIAPIDQSDLDQLENADKQKLDHGWGPNATFGYPDQGTGHIWKCVQATLPQYWFRFGQSIQKINLEEKIAIITSSNGEEEVEFDKVISTIPLDLFGPICGYGTPRLRHTSVVVTGVGVQGPTPDFLIGKSWIYFPDDSPFYRVSVLSNYFPRSTPSSNEYTLLVEQSLDPQTALALDTSSTQSSTIQQLSRKGLLKEESINHVFSFLIPYGYPIPSLDREEILRPVQTWLEKRGAYSRGRFGGWKYEVSNQDHSFMQGAEVMSKIIEDKEETVYRI